MNAPSLLVQPSFVSFLIKLQSGSCGAFWATFIFAGWEEGTSGGGEVRLPFLFVLGDQEEGPRAALRPRLRRATGAAAARVAAPSSAWRASAPGTQTRKARSA